MRGNVKIMLLLAVACGGGAIWAGERWLDNETAARMRAIEAQRPEITFKTLVVAARPLRFGAVLASRDLKEIPWPADELPTGAFETVDAVLKDGERIVLFPLETSEPVLTAKVTGPGERAALSRLIGEGNRAVTLRVNDVAGVAGFVLPGDHVDVVLTTDNKADVVLQDVRILSIDQSADERTDEPRVARTVTVEAEPEDAQKLILAQNIGNLSLVLRRAGEVRMAEFRAISNADLGTPSGDSAAIATHDSAAPGVTVWVRRARELTQYAVPGRDGGPVQPVSVLAAPGGMLPVAAEPVVPATIRTVPASAVDATPADAAPQPAGEPQ